MGRDNKIAQEDGHISIKLVINPRTKEIVSYDILSPDVDENNTNLTMKELDFLEEIRDQLKKFEPDKKRMNEDQFNELEDKRVFEWWKERVKNGEDPNPVPRKVINHYAREHENFEEIVTKSDGSHPRWFRDLVLEYMNEEYDENLRLVREENKI